MKLLSPFNGQVWIVPPDYATPEFVQMMLARGFSRVDDEDPPPKEPPRGRR